MGEEEWSSILKYAPFALDLVYLEDAVQAQLLGQHLGYQLLFSKASSKPEEPAFMVFVSMAKKEVLIAVRGTQSVEDVVTDIRSVPIPFPPSSISPLPPLARIVSEAGSYTYGDEGITLATSSDEDDEEDDEDGDSEKWKTTFRNVFLDVYIFC